MKTKKNQIGPATFQTKAQRHTPLPINALTAEGMDIGRTIAQRGAHARIVATWVMIRKTVPGETATATGVEYGAITQRPAWYRGTSGEDDGKSFSFSGLCGQRGCQGYANTIILVLSLYHQSEHFNVQQPFETTTQCCLLEYLHTHRNMLRSPSSTGLEENNPGPQPSGSDSRTDILHAHPAEFQRGSVPWRYIGGPPTLPRRPDRPDRESSRRGQQQGSTYLNGMSDWGSELET
ncbi:uncharacterized protein APUU_11105S [Aspergillus puulaauensis]|uniref:Uncharacterized protein n=1 Tax=Aspergillus puulaauensis TaxID=1220207 RepID=A0A7R7XBA8_9EURO|nr:uncharacterized protein APUU_11105S [Aspergillus puulaauensis]BCS18277.1 hypothetical protein APUU_11105S [Aspergillus puulaauensis]